MNFFLSHYAINEKLYRWWDQEIVKLAYFVGHPSGEGWKTSSYNDMIWYAPLTQDGGHYVVMAVVCLSVSTVPDANGKGMYTWYSASSWTPPQKRLGMHLFSRDLTDLPAHPLVHLQSEWAIPAIAFTAIAATHLPTPEGWKAELAHVAGYVVKQFTCLEAGKLSHYITSEDVGSWKLSGGKPMTRVTRELIWR